MRCRPALLRAWIAALLLLVAALQAAPADAATEPARVTNILILNSWHSDQPWQAEFERGLKAGLGRADINAQVYVESLDVGRLKRADVTRIFGRYLEEKYAAARIDIVLAESLPARMFLHAHPGLFPGASRVYAGTSTGPSTGRNEISDGAIRVSMEADFATAVSEMVQVAQPRRVVVVGDTSDEAGKGRLQAFRAALFNRYPDLPLSELVDLPMETLLERLAQLPSGTAVFYLLIFRDGAGRTYSPVDSARLVAASSAAPVFSHWSTLMGTGILGGYLISPERVGQAAVRIIGALARGEKAVDAANDEAFERRYDWRQVTRWAINPARLPSSAAIDFHEPGAFVIPHRREILAVLAVTGTVSTLCIVLLVLHRRLRTAHAALQAERQRLEERVASRTAELEEEVRVKNRLFSIIAHDLRGPFNALLGMTQLASQMSENFSRQQLVELAATANQEGRRIFAQLNNLLEWSRLQMDGGRVAPETVVLAPLVDEVFVSLNMQAARKDILLSNRVLGGTVFSDPTMVRTVLHNLVANAVKFTPQGGAVTVSAESQGDQLKITVSDTGMGIDEASLARLFSVGERRSTQGTAGETGTGLGLPICKQMVERNGGRIWVVSQAGKGSHFHVTLPASASDRTHAAPQGTAAAA